MEKIGVTHIRTVTAQGTEEERLAMLRVMGAGMGEAVVWEPYPGAFDSILGPEVDDEEDEGLASRALPSAHPATQEVQRLHKDAMFWRNEVDERGLARRAAEAERDALQARVAELEAALAARKAAQSERAGWNAAIAWVEKHLNDYIAECGTYDPTTNVTEFPDGGEWVGSVEEIIDGLRLAMPTAQKEGGE